MTLVPRSSVFPWPPYFWCAGTTVTLILKKKNSENLGWNFGARSIPRVAPRVASRIGFSHKFRSWVPFRELLREMHQNSESCSENGLFTPRAFFCKIGVVPRFLNTAESLAELILQSCNIQVYILRPRSRNCMRRPSVIHSPPLEE